MLVLGVLACVAPAEAYAERWVALPVERSSSLLELDDESVVKTGEFTFTATWRIRSAGSNGPSELTDVGTVDCAAEAIHLKTRTFSGGRSSSPSITDYEKGVTGDGKTWMPYADKGQAHVYPPGNGHYLGAVVASVCSRLPDFAKTRDAQIAAARGRAKCDAKAPRVAPEMCARTPEAQETLRALFLRIDQVKQACGLSKEQADSLAAGVFAQTLECRVSSRDCSVPLVKQDTDGLGSDLVRIANGESCHYTPWAVKDAAETIQRHASVESFWSCVEQAILRMDDRASSADAVADGVFGVCRNQLVPMLANSDVFATTVRPGIIARVLAHRQRPPTKPSIPSKPKPPLTV
jgi:hypothetical protein